MFDEKHEVGGFVLFVCAFALLAAEAAGAGELLADAYVAGLVLAGLGVWLGPKAVEKFNLKEFL